MIVDQIKTARKSSSWGGLIVLLFGVIFCQLPCFSQNSLTMPDWAQQERRPYSELGGSKNLAIPRTWLVEGKVLSIEPLADVVGDTENKRMKIQINHVYSGPSSLQDKIVDHLIPEPNYWYPKESNDYKKGQRLLFAVTWEVNYDQSSDLGHLRVFPSYRINRPVIIDGTDKTQIVEAHAKRIERLYSAKPEEWKPIIKEYASGQFPITTVWAIVTISDWPDLAEKYPILTQLIDIPERSALQLCTIEWQLNARGGGNKWRDSTERTKLLSKIAHIPQDDGGQLVFRTLVDASRLGSRDEITQTRFLSYLTELIDNPTVSPEVRQKIIKQPTQWIKSKYGDKIDKSDALIFWMGLLNSPKNLANLELIATEIAANAPWTGEQNESLKTILASLEAQKRADFKQQQSLENSIKLLQKAIQNKPN